MPTAMVLVQAYQDGKYDLSAVDDFEGGITLDWNACAFLIPQCLPVFPIYGTNYTNTSGSLYDFSLYSTEVVSMTSSSWGTDVHQCTPTHAAIGQAIVRTAIGRPFPAPLIYTVKQIRHKSTQRTSDQFSFHVNKIKKRFKEPSLNLRSAGMHRGSGSVTMLCNVSRLRQN